MKTKTL